MMHPLGILYTVLFSSVMFATIDFVREAFYRFNREIFNSSLNALSFRLSSSRNFLGKLCYVRKRGFFGKVKYSDFELVISKNRDMAEKLLEDTIIHEMIHYYILTNHMKDTSAHGRVFRTIMKNINEKYGRNISITYRSSQEEKEKDREIRRHIFCISRFVDGKLGITLSVSTKVHVLWKELPKSPGVIECTWYESYNPYFNRFRRSRTVKIYRIDAKELEQNMADTNPIVLENNRISVKKNRL